MVLAEVLYGPGGGAYSVGMFPHLSECCLPCLEIFFRPKWHVMTDTLLQQNLVISGTMWKCYAFELRLVLCARSTEVVG